MIERHWNRGMSMETAGGKPTSRVARSRDNPTGAASLQINEGLSGRDPRNLNPAEKGGVRNWMAGMLKGGSLGIYGDFLFLRGDATRTKPVASIMGPVIGLASRCSTSPRATSQALQGRTPTLALSW